MKTVLPLLFEYLGTFLLVFVVMITTNPFIVGLSFTIVMILVGKFNGGMSNPAITYSMYLQSKMSLKEFLSIVAVQFIAALSSYGVYTIVA
jgi:glycerol uptake facilitator-like aquaporin